MGKRWYKRLIVAVMIWAMAALGAVTAYADGALIPVGETVGISIQMKGVLVAGVTQVQTDRGSLCPAKEAGLQAGDVITAVEDSPVENAAELIAAVEAQNGGPVRMSLQRNGETRSVCVTPVREQSGALRLGLWLRDGVAGIGTVTYIDPATGAFGALGHGVNDVDTGVLLPVSRGDICRAQIVDVKRGASGAPGELAGSFDPGDVIGCINRNTVCGIFGTVTGGFGALRPAMPVGSPEEVRKGAATILTCVAGQEPAEYEVEIARSGMAAGSGRDLTVHVTDPALLERTGGIVQGMSGSPIIQNGKLVGAVTHVCVITIMPTPTRRQLHSVSSH